MPLQTSVPNKKWHVPRAPLRFPRYVVLFQQFRATKKDMRGLTITSALPWLEILEKLSLSLKIMTNAWAGCTHAVIVCGHAVFTGGLNCPPDTAANDSNWVLQTFQTGEAVHYLHHIEVGVLLAADDPRALLLFSGGQTRVGAPVSEAVGYLHAAAVHAWWGVPQVAERTTTEEFARDSFENVLFGIARFFECVGAFPQHVTVISWNFKRARFTNHAKAMHWPASKFHFMGVSNPEANALASALIAEERTLQSFHGDPTGNTPGGELRKKRDARNPSRRQSGYSVSCPLLAPVLAWEHASNLPPEITPWETK